MDPISIYSTGKLYSQLHVINFKKKHHDVFSYRKKFLNKFLWRMGKVFHIASEDACMGKGYDGDIVEGHGHYNYI